MVSLTYQAQQSCQLRSLLQIHLVLIPYLEIFSYCTRTAGCKERQFYFRVYIVAQASHFNIAHIKLTKIIGCQKGVVRLGNVSPRSAH